MRYERICLGGTFSPLHAGHVALLRKAFSLARMVMVGLTSDDMARSSRTRTVMSYEERLEGLGRCCRTLADRTGSDFRIAMISDRVGFALDPLLEAIVVSEETKSGADSINDLRSEKGIIPLDVIIVPLVTGTDGIRLSSTRLSQISTMDGDPPC